MARTRWQTLLRLTGLELSPVSHVERLVSALGGFVGILAIMVISGHFVEGYGAALIVASMGESVLRAGPSPTWVKRSPHSRVAVVSS